jgi:ubiquinone/menaquinone biosynthesis C-methylase UbiE
MNQLTEKTTVAELANLTDTISQRYAGEAESCCSLSCGQAIDLAEIKKGYVFLDLGSGRGNDVLKAAALVGAEGHAYGVDVTPKMIQVAEVNRKKLGIKNVSFLQGEIDKIPLESGIVDVVISNCTINHAKDKAAVYRDIHRVLKTGGYFVVSDVLADKPLPEEVVNDPAAWAACYGGAIVKEEYFKAVREGGFTQVEILEESAPYEKGGVMVMSVTLKGVKS